MATKDITDKQVCLAYLIYKIDNSKFATEWLQKITNQPLKVCESACERAERRELIEYGTSLRSGWLTEKGQDLIENKDLLKDALQCIARLTPFPLNLDVVTDEDAILDRAIKQAANYADVLEKN